MGKLKRTATGIAVTAVCGVSAFGLATAAPAATTDERTCRGTIGARSIDGDVRVPRGTTCRLNGTRVDGNIKVYRNATLVATRVRVGGNVQAENAKRVVVTGSRVGGSIQLKQGGSVNLTRNTVDSDIQLFSNRGRSVVLRNVVGGNLQCKSNRPRPRAAGTAWRATRKTSARGCNRLQTLQPAVKARCAAVGSPSSIPSVASFVRAISASSSAGKRWRPGSSPPPASRCTASACTEKERSMISTGWPSPPATFVCRPSTRT